MTPIDKLREAGLLPEEVERYHERRHPGGFVDTILADAALNALAAVAWEQHEKADAVSVQYELARAVLTDPDRPTRSCTLLMLAENMAADLREAREQLAAGLLAKDEEIAEWKALRWDALTDRDSEKARADEADGMVGTLKRELDLADHALEAANERAEKARLHQRHAEEVANHLVELMAATCEENGSLEMMREKANRLLAQAKAEIDHERESNHISIQQWTLWEERAKKAEAMLRLAYDDYCGAFGFEECPESDESWLADLARRTGGEG